MPKRPHQVIGIVGSRRRDSEDDYEKCVAAFFNVYRPGDKIVSGGCPQGGDRFAEIIAAGVGCEITIHYPDNERLDVMLMDAGKFRQAYAIINFARNTLIAQDCTVLIAVVAEDRKGGTEDTVKKALKLGKKVILV